MSAGNRPARNAYMGDENNKIMWLISNALKNVELGKRAFAGAIKDKNRLFEGASHGIIFLNAIEEMLLVLAQSEQKFL